MSSTITPAGTLRRVAAAAATAAQLAGALTACTHADTKKDAGVAPNPPEATASTATLNVKVARVAGTLRKPARTKLADSVKATLQEYVDDAFLGDYPRSDFADAFSSFTAGAAKQARKDTDLVSAAPYKASQAVDAQKLAAELTVFSPGGTPAGVTAKVRFGFDVDGTPVTYAGRLLLTKEKGAWRIFGYDLRRNDQASGASQ
jgi:hypothetical protein